MKIRGHQKFRYQLLAQNNGIKLVAHVEDLDETTVSFNYNASHRYIKFEEVLEQLNSISNSKKNNAVIIPILCLFSIFSIIFGGTVIIWQPNFFACK